MTNPTDAIVAKLMALADDYTDAFHAAMRPDGGLGFAEGMVAKAKKEALVAALREAIDQGPVVAWGLLKPDGSIDHDLVGSKADCEFWSRAEKEPQCGWAVVPLYAGRKTP